MYTVKEAAKQLGFTEHTIRFYTDKGLVPGVMRDKNNCRLFTEECMNWLIGVKHLKECGMTLDYIKTYIELCLQGDSTIETRYHIILKQKEIAKRQLEEAKQRLDYMEKKAKLYRKIMENHIPDSTNPAKWPVKSAQ